jgi:uncharacterized protein (TIGR03435 family)
MHEMCHVRRRDNLFAAVHMVVEAIFWFDPLVWWIGSRMVEERELACDEEVVRMGCEPADYVEGILKVCRFYRESPLPCVSGVSGADVKKRLRAILAGSISRDLTAGRKVILAAMGLAVLAAPIVIGVLSPPTIRAEPQQPTVDRAVPAQVKPPTAPQIIAQQTVAQAAPAAKPPLVYEAASIRPARADHPDGIGPSGGPGTADPNRVRYSYYPLSLLMMIAYDMNVHQISLPEGLHSGDRYDIVANVPPGTTRAQALAMLQNLLIDRFHLKLHRETRNLAHYELIVAQNGPKLNLLGSSSEPTADDGAIGVRVGPDRNYMHARKARMKELTQVLSDDLDTPVLDKTGLVGQYDFDFEYSREGLAGLPRSIPDAPEVSAAPTLLIALQESLGLKLDSKKGPVDMLVVDSGDKVPSGN